MPALRTGLLGQKLGMTHVFREGLRIGVTVVQAGTCVVLGKRTVEKDGYSAVQIGFGEKPLRLCNKPELGIANKLSVKAPRLIREFRLDPKQVDQFEIGKAIPVSSVIKPETFIDVVGQSKGKGFQGVIKRHHMAASVNSHGSHEFFRHGGSIGCRLTPGRVHLGKRMTGHMGDERVTVESVTVVEVNDEQGLVLLRGSVPGARGGYLELRNSTKRTGQARLTPDDGEQQKKKGAAKKPAAKKK